MASTPATGAVAPSRAAASQGWHRTKRIAVWVFFSLVVFLVVRQARTIDWRNVLASVREIPLPMLLAGAGLAACSHVLYSTYDLLGRRMTGHRLRTVPVMGVTFISYAFNLNLGALVGGVAFRYRLYSRLGLDGNTITRVLGFSMLTNWFGYFVVAGAAFCFWPMSPPPDWTLGGEGLRILGAVLMLVGLAYLALCAIAREHTWRVRGHELDTPPLRIALLQMVISCTNWSLMGGVIWFLLEQKLPYPTVLSVFLVAAVAGVITHVPGGLGVLEAVFLALLSHLLSQDQLLGALLAYRALYYLLPLIVACVIYVVTEVHARRLRRRSSVPLP
jgi:glycosyltransferase 2 family protein